MSMYPLIKPMPTSSEYKGFDASPRYDTFGNLICWLPFGVSGKTILGYGEWDDYTPTRKELSDSQNNSTLVGLPVFVYHPKEGIITPDSKTSSVGVCLGMWRESSTGVFEVQARITHKKTIESILSKKLIETSAGYLSRDDVRVYNHLALVPIGTARGGEEMSIKLESTNHKTKMTLDTSITIQTEQIANSVIKQLKTESSEIKTLIAEAKLEGYAEGMKRGEKIANIRLRAEALGFKVEADKDAVKELYKPVVGKFIPGLLKYECSCSEEQAGDFLEAAITAGEAGAANKEEMMKGEMMKGEMMKGEMMKGEMMKGEMMQEDPKTAEVKTESIRTPRLESTSHNPEETKRKSINFIL